MFPVPLLAKTQSASSSSAFANKQRPIWKSHKPSRGHNDPDAKPMSSIATCPLSAELAIASNSSCKENNYVNNFKHRNTTQKFSEPEGMPTRASFQILPWVELIIHRLSFSVFLFKFTRIVSKSSP